MADNVIADAGSGGATFATDDIGGVHYPITKITIGALDSQTLLSGGNGTVDAGTIRVTVASDSTGVLSVDDNGGALTVDNAGTFAVQVDGDALTALQLIDDAVYTDATGTPSKGLAVMGTDGTNPQILACATDGALHIDDGGNSITIDGTVTANLSATDNAVLDSIDAAVNGTLTVGSHAVTNAGTFAVQEDGAALTALQLIDDAVYVDDADWTDSTSKHLLVGGVYQSTPQTITDGDVGPFQVTTNGYLIVSVNGTVTVGAHDVTNAGTFAVQVDGDALTALQLIDDPVFADDAAFTLASSKVMMAGAIRDDSLSALTAAEGDAVPLRVGSTGALHVTGAGGGTQYNVDDAAGATDTGTLALAIRDDALTTLTPADGDYVGLRVSSTGALHVTGGGGGTEYTEDVATPDPIVGTASLMERDDALATLTPIEGDWVGMRATAEGALWTQDFNSDALLADTNTIAGAVTGTEMQVDVVAALPAGTNAIGKLAANDGVDIGDVDVTSVVPGTGASNLGKAEDAVHTSGDVGVMGLAVRTDTPANKSGANGDYEPLQISAGRLWTSSQITALTPGTAAANLGKAEDAAHTSGDVGVMGLAVRTDSPVARSGTDGDYEPLQISAGRLWASATIDAALPAGTNAIGKLAANSGVDIGDVDVLSIAAGSNLIGDVSLQPRTTGGLSFFKSIDLDETEEEVKATAGQIYAIHAMNLASTKMYLKLYNATAATVVVGTTVPDITIPLPTQGDTNGAGFTWTIPQGIAFGTAITAAATTGIADNDSGAPGANEVVLTLLYK